MLAARRSGMVVKLRPPATRLGRLTVTDSDLNSLMTRLADGDRSVFRAVFDQLWPPTLRLCTSMLRNDADAADAAQQAMTKILERASDYDTQRPALPWALAIAAWECKTILRKRLRRREAPQDLAPERGGSDAEQEQEQEIMSQQLVTLALAVIEQLSEIDRGVLEATFMDEAARMTGATARKRRERAIVRLRAAFGRLYGID
jgi:RNA polymerase sigma-70 factor, ECF subfamily